MKIMWIITAIFYLLFIIVEIFLGSRVHYQDNRIPSGSEVGIDYLFSFTVPLIQGITISSILSLVPFKRLPYKVKFQAILPIAIAIVSAFTAYAYLRVGYLKANARKNLSEINKTEIQKKSAK